MSIIRTFWAYLNGVVATFFLSQVAIGAGLVGHRGGIYDWVARTWSSWILWASGVKVVVEGLDHVRGDRPQIICSNHQSWFDVFALASTIPKRFRFIAKEELRKIPMFGKAWESSGHISINRKDRNRAIEALDEAAELVRSDNSTIVIFPEGTRSSDGQLLPFKKGAFMLALHTGLEIVPTACIGSRAIQKKGGWLVHSGTVIVRFGEPVDSARFGENDREELMGVVRREIAELLNDPARIRETK